MIGFPARYNLSATSICSTVPYILSAIHSNNFADDNCTCHLSPVCSGSLSPSSHDGTHLDCLCHVQALEGRGEARTWLIPLLRQHVRSAQLAFWAEHLLPLARLLGSRAAQAQQQGKPIEAQQCRALELQLWNTLQAFCSWAVDTAGAFRSAVSADA